LRRCILLLIGMPRLGRRNDAGYGEGGAKTGDDGMGAQGGAADAQGSASRRVGGEIEVLRALNRRELLAAFPAAWMCLGRVYRGSPQAPTPGYFL
jgi:hypothetical protein